jgi:hypothetical protein
MPIEVPLAWFTAWLCGLCVKQQMFESYSCKSRGHFLLQHFDMKQKKAQPSHTLAGSANTPA